VTAPTEHAVAWIGPDPERVEAASVTLAADRLSARGSSTAADYVADWVLETGPSWVTRRFSVRTRGDEWHRTLDLARSAAGSWSAILHTDARASEPLDVSGLENALDCDLALCPFTNTMPVLRHDLVAAANRGEPRSVDLVMAWIAVPELMIQVSQQQYRTRGPATGGGALIDFASTDFETTIEFDRHGLVIDYPDLARRLVAR
jgi:hypothetical protein